MPKRPPSYRPPTPVGARTVDRRPPKGAKASGDHARGHSRARGYDRAWERLRAWFLVQFPYCRFCEAKGITRLAADVDHIITIEERPDLRLDPDNLQSLCRPCHRSVKQRLDRARKRALALGATPPPLSPPAGRGRPTTGGRGQKSGG